MSEAIEKAQLTVLCVPLAGVDRRALSQAWYSALHMHTTEEGRSRKTCGVGRASPERLTIIAGSEHNQPRFPCADASPRKTARAQTTPMAPCERRTVRSPLARKIREAFFSGQCHTHTATFALQGGNGRVHMVLRIEGREIRLIAVCAPKARELVRTALAQARYALASTGLRLHASLELAAS